MSALAERLQRIWYDQAPVPWWLDALESVYRGVLAVRRALYRTGWKRSTRVDVPVVVIGNITVGGTGKTPLVQWLTEELTQRGWKPGIVMRGYGARVRGARRVEGTDLASAVGDEAVLLAHCHARAVAVARRRADAARLLIDEVGCDVIIADDGLQHWSLARDLEIAVIDGRRRLGNGRLLPAGPLREPAERLQRVDYIVCNGEPREGEIGMRVGARHVMPLREPSRILPLETFRGQRAHAVAGIGNPQRFFDTLRAAGIDAIEHPLPDHYAYRGDELEFGDELPVLITEKDAVKCAAFAHERVFVAPAEAHLPAGFADRIHASLHALRARGGA